MKTEDGSTRKVIVTMLKTKGPLSAGEMAKQLGITEMAVRRHLHTLERDQLIEAKLVRQAMGRPAHLYSLTEHADDLFPKKYQHLAMDLLEELELTAGADKVDFLFDRRKERLSLTLPGTDGCQGLGGPRQGTGGDPERQRLYG
ncbi:transcriptional regulator [Paenibacillus mucilaginosus 3016]|uniref:Transcriptional regulator n=1 Tax=Paenibacillus mucilaginosus 3016 TaxID=1116391 RepID=H6NH57_9BACL|nr:transcriptional regulator [Paenibacillus mucilaginosus 3016]